MSEGYFGGFARSMSFRSHAMPSASTFSHCAGVRRMDRCSSFSSGGVGGLPRGRFVGSMPQVYVTQKRLAIRCLLNHNNYINNAPEPTMQTNTQVTGLYCGTQFSGVITSQRALTVPTDGAFEHFVQLDEPVTVFGEERSVLVVVTRFDGSSSSYTRHSSRMHAA